MLNKMRNKRNVDYRSTDTGTSVRKAWPLLYCRTQKVGARLAGSQIVQSCTLKVRPERTNGNVDLCSASALAEARAGSGPSTIDCSDTFGNGQEPPIALEGRVEDGEAREWERALAAQSGRRAPVGAV